MKLDFAKRLFVQGSSFFTGKSKVKQLTTEEKGANSEEGSFTLCQSNSPQPPRRPRKAWNESPASRKRRLSTVTEESKDSEGSEVTPDRTADQDGAVNRPLSANCIYIPTARSDENDDGAAMLDDRRKSTPNAYQEQSIVDLKKLAACFQIHEDQDDADEDDHCAALYSEYNEQRERLPNDTEVESWMSKTQGVEVKDTSKPDLKITPPETEDKAQIRQKLASDKDGTTDNGVSHDNSKQTSVDISTATSKSSEQDNHTTSSDPRVEVNSSHLQQSESVSVNDSAMPASTKDIERKASLTERSQVSAPVPEVTATNCTVNLPGSTQDNRCVPSRPNSAATSRPQSALTRTRLAEISAQNKRLLSMTAANADPEFIEETISARRQLSPLRSGRRTRPSTAATTFTTSLSDPCSPTVYSLVSSSARMHTRSSIHQKSRYSSHRKVLKRSGLVKSEPMYRRTVRQLGTTTLDSINSTKTEEESQEVETDHRDNVSVLSTDTNKDSADKDSRQSRKPEASDTEYIGRGVRVNPSKLVSYLKLVQQHPDEYVSFKQELDHSESKPVRRLLGLGRAFSRGSNQTNKPESLVVQAAYELGCKFSHPVCRKYEASRQRTAQDSSGKAARRGSSAPPASRANDGLSEFERSRAEVEIWMRTLTTAQVVKARELALQALREEDAGLRKWWISHKYCRYLRMRHRPDQLEQFV